MMKQLIVTGLTKHLVKGIISFMLYQMWTCPLKRWISGNYGASGSGKTTLLNCISTIDKPTSGEIRFEDFDIIHAKENELADYRAKNISYIFQAYNLVETFTVYENIVLPLQIQGKISKHQDKIEEILDKLAIQNLKDKFPNQLSGWSETTWQLLEPWLMILNWLSQMSRQEPWTLPILKTDGTFAGNQ